MKGGACVAGGMHAIETATEVGGTHPTGMHSCSKNMSIGGSKGSTGDAHRPINVVMQRSRDR